MRSVALAIIVMAVALLLGCGGDDAEKEFFTVPLREADIFALTLGDETLVNLTDTPGNDYDPDWSADGEKVLFASDRDGNWEVYVMDADGGGQVNLTNGLGDDWEPAWSPTGQFIVFVSNRDGNAELYVMKADGSEPTRITDDPGNDWEPVWSADTKTIIFASDRDGDFELCSLELPEAMWDVEPGGDAEPAQDEEPTFPEVTALTDNNRDDVHPELSPSENSIVYLTDRNRGEMWFADGDGSDPIFFVRTRWLHSSISWSASGNQIAYAHERGVNWSEIYVANPAGGKVLRSIRPDNDHSDGYPAFSPDGNTLLFTRWQRSIEPY